MKLSIDPETVKCDEIDALADDAFVAEISILLGLNTDERSTLKSSLVKMYREFMDGHYDVRKSLPEHEESNALMKVHDAAEALHRSMMDLYEYGNTDRRFSSALLKRDNRQYRPEIGHGIWHQMMDSWNPNLYVRRAIIDIQVAALTAADQPNKEKTSPELNDELKRESDPTRRKLLEEEIAMTEFSESLNSNRVEEYRQRVKERKTPKDLPIRNSIITLKNFFEEHTNIPFTAGKYHPDNGYVTHAFEAVKMALQKIYPQVSDRKIAGIMQELSSEQGYKNSTQN